jgi:hypothetical protein
MSNYGLPSWTQEPVVDPIVSLWYFLLVPLKCIFSNTPRKNLMKLQFRREFAIHFRSVSHFSGTVRWVPDNRCVSQYATVYLGGEHVKGAGLDHNTRWKTITLGLLSTTKRSIDVFNVTSKNWGRVKVRNIIRIVVYMYIVRNRESPYCNMLNEDNSSRRRWQSPLKEK